VVLVTIFFSGGPGGTGSAGGAGVGGSGSPQAATVREHRPFGTLGEVVPQVPAVGDLLGSWRAGAGAVGVGTGPVAADHPGAGMLLEPGGKRLRLAVFQQVDGPVGGHVHQHGAVGPAAAEREVVHAQHGHLVDLGIGQRAQQPQQRVTACRQPKPRGQPRPGAARQRQHDLLQQRAQHRGAPSVAGGQPGELFGGRSRWAVGVVAEESAHPKAQHHPPAANCRVGEPALVAAMHPGRGAATPGTGGRGGAGVCPDVHAVFDLLDPLDRNGGQVRKEAVKTLVITYRRRSRSGPPIRRRFHHEMCARASFP
jgi:hypothetical protein